MTHLLDSPYHVYLLLCREDAAQPFHRAAAWQPLYDCISELVKLSGKTGEISASYLDQQTWKGYNTGAKKWNEKTARGWTDMDLQKKLPIQFSDLEISFPSFQAYYDEDVMPDFLLRVRYNVIVSRNYYDFGLALIPSGQFQASHPQAVAAAVQCLRAQLQVVQALHTVRPFGYREDESMYAGGVVHKNLLSDYVIAGVLNSEGQIDDDYKDWQVL